MGKEISVDMRSYERLLLQLQEQAEVGEVAATITVEGEAQKYWRSLEWGSTIGQRPWPSPGPKTRTGSGLRTGRIMSKQAPAGFVYRWANQFINFLRDAYIKRVRAKNAPLNRAELSAAANEAGEKAMQLIQAGVPVDSGQLRDSIKLEKAK